MIDENEPVAEERSRLLGAIGSSFGLLDTFIQARVNADAGAEHLLKEKLRGLTTSAFGLSPESAFGRILDEYFEVMHKAMISDHWEYGKPLTTGTLFWHLLSQVNGSFEEYHDLNDLTSNRYLRIPYRIVRPSIKSGVYDIHQVTLVINEHLASNWTIDWDVQCRSYTSKQAAVIAEVLLFYMPFEFDGGYDDQRHWYSQILFWKYYADHIDACS